MDFLVVLSLGCWTLVHQDVIVNWIELGKDWKLYGLKSWGFYLYIFCTISPISLPTPLYISRFTYIKMLKFCLSVCLTERNPHLQPLKRRWMNSPPSPSPPHRRVSQRNTRYRTQNGYQGAALSICNSHLALKRARGSRVRPCIRLQKN